MFGHKPVAFVRSVADSAVGCCCSNSAVVCLLLCLFACLLVCLFAGVFVCLLASLFVCLFACLLACLFVCWLCLLASLFVGLVWFGFLFVLFTYFFVWFFVCLVALVFKGSAWRMNPIPLVTDPAWTDPTEARTEGCNSSRTLYFILLF